MWLFLLPAIFLNPVQKVPLTFGQREAVVVFDADTEIKAARSLCECTKVSIDKKKLIARVDVSGFAQDAKKEIEATTTDGKKVRLTMDIRVPQAIEINTRTLIWKTGAKAEARDVRVKIPAGSPVKKLSGADLSGDAFDYKAIIVKAGEEYCVRVYPKDTRKPVLNRLIIRTDSKDPRYAAYIVYLSVQK